MHYRSQLFVPGNRPDRFEKACAAGADLVCIDLEDAVGPNEKDEAREATLAFLSETQHKHVSLRINALETPFAKKDIAALKESNLTLPFLMIPKAASKSVIADLDDDLHNDLGPFFVILENAAGMLNAAEIFSLGRVKLGMYGAVDYAGDVGCDLAWETHLYARSHCAAAATAWNVQLFDTPHISVRDLDDCEITTRKAKALGYYARSAIHPAQIARIHAALMPSAEEIDHARKVIEAYHLAEGNVVLLDGKFIEAPIVKSAERILAFAQAQNI